MAFFHFLNATGGRGEGVDADKLGLVARPLLFQHLSGAQGHTVVLAKDAVDLFAAFEHLGHHLLAALLRPVACTAVYEPHAGMVAQRIDQSAMALDGWR